MSIIKTTAERVGTVYVPASWLETVARDLRAALASGRKA